MFRLFIIVINREKRGEISPPGLNYQDCYQNPYLHRHCKLKLIKALSVMFLARGYYTMSMIEVFSLEFPEETKIRLKGISLEEIYKEKIPLRELDRDIYAVLKDPEASYGGIRGISLKMMNQGRLTEDEAFWVIEKNNKWNTWDATGTREKLHDLWLYLHRNESGAKPSPQARLSSPALPISDIDINELITKVQWRKPEVKPTVESIKHYFINNFETNAFQVLPNKYNLNVAYKPMKHIDKNIWRHLETAINSTFNKPFTYGAYEKNKEDKGKWICFDLDVEKDDKHGSNLRKAHEIIGYFESRGISPMLENASEGIESYHVWVFCDPTDIEILKAIGKDARDACKIDSKECEVSPKCTPGSPLGNLVRIPFGLHRKRNRKSKVMTYDKGAAIALYNLKALLPHGA